MSLFVAITIISASVIPALNRESLDRTLPVTNRQSRYWDSFIAVGSVSMRATLLFSCLRAAATPRPTSPAPAMITLIDSMPPRYEYNTAPYVCPIMRLNQGVFDCWLSSSSCTNEPLVLDSEAFLCLSDCLVVLLYACLAAGVSPDGIQLE